MTRFPTKAGRASAATSFTIALATLADVIIAIHSPKLTRLFCPSFEIRHSCLPCLYAAQNLLPHPFHLFGTHSRPDPLYVHALGTFSRRLVRGGNPRSSGYPRRQELWILAHEVAQIFFEWHFAFVAVRQQPAVLRAEYAVVHRSVCQVDLRNPQPLYLPPDARPSLRLLRRLPAALALFFHFVQPPLQLLAAFAFLHEFRFVGRFALGLLLLEELLNCLLHNRLYVCVFHKHLFSQAAPALRLAQRRIPH